MPLEIIIRIDAQANIEIEANGFKGKACEEKMKDFIEALGVPISSIKKPEYYNEDETRLYN